MYLMTWHCRASTDRMAVSHRCIDFIMEAWAPLTVRVAVTSQCHVVICRYCRLCCASVALLSSIAVHAAQPLIADVALLKQMRLSDDDNDIEYQWR